MGLVRLGGGRMNHDDRCFVLRCKGQDRYLTNRLGVYSSIETDLGDLEAEYGGHEAGGNLCRLFLSHPTRVQGLVATTLSVPKTA